MVKGIESTASSLILKSKQIIYFTNAGFKSPVDSTVVRKLKEAGAIIVGKTNMDEFGMG